MLKKAVFLLSILCGFSAQAAEDDFVQGAVQGPVYVYRSADGFDTTKAMLEMAVVNQGLKISSTLHIQEMLERTGKDLGFEKAVYEKAESIEFCSALMAHKMFQAAPVNLAICPLIIAVYSEAGAPESVYVSFRRFQLAGDAEGKLAAEIEAWMHTIVKEALGLD